MRNVALLFVHASLFFGLGCSARSSLKSPYPIPDVGPLVVDHGGLSWSRETTPDGGVLDIPSLGGKLFTGRTQDQTFQDANGKKHFRGEYYYKDGKLVYSYTKSPSLDDKSFERTEQWLIGPNNKYHLFEYVPDADGWADYARGTREEIIGILQTVIEKKKFDKNGNLTHHEIEGKVILDKRSGVGLREK